MRTKQLIMARVIEGIADVDEIRITRTDWSFER
jgi:hypothetical protein